MPFIAFIKRLFKKEHHVEDNTLDPPPDVIILNPTILEKESCSCDNPKCKCGKKSNAKKPRKPRTKKSAVK